MPQAQAAARAHCGGHGHASPGHGCGRGSGGGRDAASAGAGGAGAVHTSGSGGRPAPEDAAFTRTQLDAFEALARKLRGAGYTLPPLHAQASCGILNQPQPDCGYARPGIALYGALSTAGCAARLHPVLAPALALRARVVSVRRVPPGEGAGYGLAFRARRSTRLAVVAIGYADGWPRAAGEGRGHVLLHGRRAPVVGRVCMDQLLVDATDTGAAVGDVATLIGADGPERITAEEAAEAAGTIANELCAASVPACPAFICAEEQKPRGVVAHNAAGRSSSQ